MNRKHLITAAFAGCLFFFCSSPLFGQATFAVGNSTTTAADIGVTELTGQITLTVMSGISVAAPLSIQYSAPITNNSASEIQVTGTGGLVNIEPNPSLDRLNNAILISVPAGGGSASQIRIVGVRVATAGLDDTRVTANITGLTAGGNTVAVGQNKVTVVDRIVPPFQVELSSIPLEWRNGVPVNPGTSFLIRETYPADFTNSIGLLGQTAPTRFRVKPFPSVPSGVKVTFSTIAASTETLATLTTVSGSPETVPRADGSTDVLYQYASAIGSPATIESFQVFVSIEVDPAAGSGSLTFQATMEPIGVAIPNATYPSTDIPRYLPRTLPDEADLVTGSTELAFPFRAANAAVYTGVAITNPLEYRVRATLTAYDTNGLLISGLKITNPVPLILPRSGQFAKLATEIFGEGFNASTAGTLRVLGSTPVLAGFYLQWGEGGSRLDGATASLDPVRTWVWPVIFKQNPSPSTTLELFNPGAGPANATLTLFDSGGRQITASVTQEIFPGGSIIRDFREMFPTVDPGSFSGGYVKGRAETPLVVRETFGNSLDSNVLPGDAGTQQTRFLVAHFAAGGGYTTEITLINLDATTPAEITMTLMDGSGIPFAFAGNPASFTVSPGTQDIRSIASLFPALGSSLTTGYVQLDVKPVNVGPFTSTPPLAGAVRFSAADGSGSSALPLFIAPASDFIYAHVAESLGYYTGIAILNMNSTPTTVQVGIFKADGAPVGSSTMILQPGQKIAKVLHELVPASFGQVGGYIRIKSTLPVTSFSLFGTNDGLSLSAIPPQNVGN